ncbi:gp53-like domain-containing protein, partial [Pseudomonas qingdaonensis]
MQLIGDSTNTANGSKEFTQGQPGAGVDATIITAAWLNAIQRELVNLVIGSGLTLDPLDDSQLLKAIKKTQ